MPFPLHDGRCPERVGILERKAGDHQRHKTCQQQHMLHALVQGQAHLPVANAILLQNAARLAPPIQQIVQNHEAENEWNGQQVESLDEIERATAGGGCGQAYAPGRW